MPTPTNSEFVAQVVSATRNGVTRRYLTVFMCFARPGSTVSLAKLPPANDGTPRFSLTYQCGPTGITWQPWVGTIESDAPVNGQILINGNPVVVEEPPDDVVGCGT